MYQKICSIARLTGTRKPQAVYKRVKRGLSLRRGREYLGEFEWNEELYLVTRDRVPVYLNTEPVSFESCNKKVPATVVENPANR